MSSYYRSTVDGSIITVDDSGVPAGELLERRDDLAYGFVFEFAPDCAPGALSTGERAAREAIVARVAAATSQTVTVTDYLGTGEATNDRAAELRDQAAAALAPITLPGFAAFAGEIPTPPVIPSPGPGYFS